MPEKNNEDTEDATVRGENIFVRITTVGAIFTSFGLAVWWASALQADVRGVQRDVATIRQAVQALDRVNTLESKFNEMHQYGSAVSQRIEAQLNTLRKEFDLHVATTVGK